MIDLGILTVPPLYLAVETQSMTDLGYANYLEVGLWHGLAPEAGYRKASVQRLTAQVCLFSCALICGL